MSDNNTASELPASRSYPDADWTSRIIGAALFVWIVGVTATVQIIAWVSQQVSGAEAGGGLTDPDFLATVVQGVLLLVPLAPLALVWNNPRYRLIFRLWFSAAVFSLFAAVIHLPGATSAYTSIFLQILVSIVFALGMLVTNRLLRAGGPAGLHRDPRAMAIALAASPLLLLPWAAMGALGGPLEAALNLLAALLFGLCAALLLRQLIGLAAPDMVLDNRLRLLGAFVAGATLTPMAAAYAFGGNQLLLLFAVPAASWIVISLLGRGHDTLALTVLIGLVSAGPLLFVDPREMALVLSFGLFSTLGIAFRAALIALLLAWLAGAVLLVWRWLGRRSEGIDATSGRSGWSWLFLAAPGWMALALVFILTGNQNFYGDRLFVILRNQADVSEAENFEDVAERREYVYRTLVEHATTTQESLHDELSRWGFDFTPYYLVNGLEVEGGPLLRLWLENRPEVDRVLYSPFLRPAPPEGADSLAIPEPAEPPWNISMIGADAVWEQFEARGEGIVVGQSDSGVQWDHPQLVDSYRGSDGNHDYNWYDPWYQTAQPTDTGGHGTHTLGTVLGNVTGVAPDATWFACANLARNVGSTAYYLDCMQFMLAPFPLGGDPFRDGDASLGANVLNNSWGCPELEGCDAQSLLPAVRALRHAGTFVVVSAGNDGPACSSLNSPPAIYDEVFSVGAIDRFSNITNFSSRGPVLRDGSQRTKPDVVAPGLDILSAYPNSSYRSWQGTSMAGPHVAGVVALVWSANPQLIGDIATTEAILLETAQPLTGPSAVCGGVTTPNNTFGYGMVDALAAVRRAVSMDINLGN